MSYDKRMPRTMQEAFGPYTSHTIYAARPRSSRWVKVLYGVLLISAIAGCVLAK